MTDPAHPTRTGNSVSGDTSPDLTFTKNTRTEAMWLNAQENLGSDQFIIATTFEAGVAKHKWGRRLKIVYWDTFRQIKTAEFDSSENASPQRRILKIPRNGQHNYVRSSAEQAAKRIPEGANPSQADARLLHMWEAKQSLERRLQRQKLNRNLRRRLAALNREIDGYANQLTRQNWYRTCDSMEPQVGLAKNWSILR